MNMEASCGKGLAERSALPAKIAELTKLLADVLAVHQEALDTRDENGRREVAAYVRLEGELRVVAGLLTSIANAMAGYHDLPPAPHNKAVMARKETIDAFARFVAGERELVELLNAAIEGDQKMLEQLS
jgi:hypothetical protein